MTMVYIIVGYAVGFLVFPFFWSFLAGWPLAEARTDDADAMFSLLLCVFWPVVVSAVLVYGWWCAMSSLGGWARGLYDRAWKDFARWARES